MVSTPFLFRISLALAAALVASGACAQTTGSYNAGQALFTTTLSPSCAGCHSTTAGATDPRSLTSIRTKITNRMTPAGAAGTMSFSKALEALDKALTGTSLGGVVTGMFGFYMLTSTQRGDLAAYIANLPPTAPIISYSPSGGAIFGATAVGASATTTVTIRNTGTAPLTFATNNAVTIASGGDAADFRVGSSTCPAMTLQPNTDSCTIGVIFTPSAGASQTRTASLGLTTTTSTSLVPLQGSVATSTTPSTPPPGSAANPPTGGGGGATTWIWAGWLALALLLRRLRIARTDAPMRAFCVLRPARLRPS